MGKDNSLFEGMSPTEQQEFKNTEDYQTFSVKQATSSYDAENIVQSIFGLTPTKTTIQQYHNSIKCIPTDLEIFEDIMEQSPVMQQTIAKGMNIIPTFKYLYQDIYLSLIKYSPEIVPEAEMYTSTRMNHGILSKIINTPEYINLRRNCRLDIFNAILGAESIGQELIKSFTTAMQNIDNADKQKQELQNLLEQEQKIKEMTADNMEIKEMLNNISFTGGNKQELLDKQKNNNITIEQARKLANLSAEQCQDLIDKNQESRQITRKLGATFDATATQIQKTSELCQAWGLQGSDKVSRVDFHNKREAVERIRKSKKLKKLTDLIGRFKESAITEQKKKSKDGAVELSSVTVGDKIQDTLPSERINLAMKSTKADFYRRYTEKNLLVYAKDAHKQKTKGPIIICVDTSGSMSGDAEIWSKAMTIAVLEIAQMQGRDFACIIYAYTAKKPIIIKKGEIDPQKIINCAELFLDGGTDWEKPLKEAIKLINESTFKNADILFITDGQCSLGDSFLQEYNKIKEEKEFKTRGILININTHCSPRTMRLFCDDIIELSSFTDLKDANALANKNIFGSL